MTRTAKPKTHAHKIPARIRHKRAQQHRDAIFAAMDRCTARVNAYDAISSKSGPALANRWLIAYKRLSDFVKA